MEAPGIAGVVAGARVRRAAQVEAGPEVFEFDAGGGAGRRVGGAVVDDAVRRDVNDLLEEVLKSAT